jgi:hypothetical protein
MPVRAEELPPLLCRNGVQAAAQAEPAREAAATPYLGARGV